MEETPGLVCDFDTWIEHEANENDLVSVDVDLDEAIKARAAKGLFAGDDSEWDYPHYYCRELKASNGQALWILTRHMQLGGHNITEEYFEDALRYPSDAHKHLHKLKYLIDGQAYSAGQLLSRAKPFLDYIDAHYGSEAKLIKRNIRKFLRAMAREG